MRDGGGHFEGEAAGVVAEKRTAFAGAGHDDFRVLTAGNFKDEGAVEFDLDKFFHEGAPVNTAFSGWAVIIAAAFVVVNVEHSQIGGEFVNELVKVAREERVACVETGSNLGGFERAEDPHDVS